MTSQPEHPRCSLALHKKVLQYSPSIVQGRSPILQFFHKKFNAFDNFEITTPTHMGATHAISKIEQKSQNRIPRELDQKFGIPGIGTIH